MNVAKKKKKKLHVFMNKLHFLFSLNIYQQKNVLLQNITFCIYAVKNSEGSVLVCCHINPREKITGVRQGVCGHMCMYVGYFDCSHTVQPTDS